MRERNVGAARAERKLHLFDEIVDTWAIGRFAAYNHQGPVEVDDVLDGVGRQTWI